MSTTNAILIGRTVRLPNGRHWCGSSLAHSACRFAGDPEGELLHCDADGRAWSDCPYHASGFVNIFGDPP